MYLKLIRMVSMTIDCMSYTQASSYMIDSATIDFHPYVKTCPLISFL